MVRVALQFGRRTRKAAISSSSFARAMGPSLCEKSACAVVESDARCSVEKQMTLNHKDSVRRKPEPGTRY